MVRVTCSSCKASYDLSEETVDTNSEWMECPFCSCLSLNPFYEDGKEET